MHITSRAQIFEALTFLALFICLLVHSACSGEGVSAPSTSGPSTPIEQKGPFRFGPFYGFDSIHHYEYSYSEFKLNRVGLPGVDTAKVMTSILGFSVDVSSRRNDTTWFEVGKRSLTATLDSASGARDTTYDTSYSYVAYQQDGNTFKVVSGAPPFPILDMAFVTDIDTLPISPTNAMPIRILNLSDSRNGAPPEYSHVFSSGYSGGGSGSSEIGKYRAGVGLIHYFSGSAWYNVTVNLIGAN